VSAPFRRVDPRRLRLIVITDAAMAAPRDLLDVVERSLRAGAPAIQLRDKHLSSRALLAAAKELRAITAEYEALFFVNDRVDVALLAGADGAHLGPDDLPVSAARAMVPSTFILGASADDPAVARALVAEGADYIGCGAVWPTGSKVDAGETIGIVGLERVVQAVGVPVLGIGGITPERAEEVAAVGAGLAVVGAVMGAPDPGAAVRALLAPYRAGRTLRACTDADGGG
jgi:thiamine-phosphate diphosphorylase